ncbi:MAG: hypothetical protein JNM24_15685 [Bdellovibrionaceae bacterium]|nr:hypothetical protein [Pseudobdellovibrionaceae bacterium]
MSKLYGIIFSLGLIFFAEVAFAVHSFGVITDLEYQQREGEGQKPKTAYQNFFTLEQNWSNQSSKFIGQLRIFEYYKKFKDTDQMLHEVYPAEFNYELNSGRHRFTIGYQSLFLTEGFNLIDMEIFHARNNNISIFSLPEKLYYTSPGISYKMIGDKLSIQMAILKFERTEQLGLVQKQVLGESFVLYKPIKKPQFEKASEYDSLLKLLGSTEYFDWSIYATRTYEKRLNLQWSATNFEFSQVSVPFNSAGIGFSGPAGSYMFRWDYQKNFKRTYITETGTELSLDQTNYNLSVERTFADKMRATIMFGRTEITPEKELPTRQNGISDLFINLNYKFSEILNLDVNLFDRLGTQTQGMGAAFNNKVLANIELRFGFESFWTGPNSRLAPLDQEDKIYFGVKATVF